MRFSITTWCLIALMNSAVAQTAQPLKLHWDDEFSASEQQMLATWLEKTYSGLEQTAGPLPFAVDVHMHRKDDANEPVPWAHTARTHGEELHFYVDPQFPLQQFLSDWTAAHEMSHLLIPFMGKNNSWFAEGFASYMQYQVMVSMGVITPKQAQQNYHEKVARARHGYRYPKQNFIDAGPNIIAARDYPVLYWGGAVYFLQLDARFTQHGTTFLEVLKQYLLCCRMQNQTLDRLIHHWNTITRTEIASDELNNFQHTVGFPQPPN